MTREPEVPETFEGLYRRNVNSALVISAQSVAWTVVASTAAVVLGIQSRSTVLLAFGAIGFVDAIGSIALAYHFHHGLGHGALSEHLEQRAHRIVLVGLLLVGSAAIVGGVVRLATGQSTDPTDYGVALVAVSLVVLLGLSVRKIQVARRVSSDALRSDGHVSANGAMQAAVTLLGTVATLWLGWQ